MEIQQNFQELAGLNKNKIPISVTDVDFYKQQNDINQNNIHQQFGNQMENQSTVIVSSISPLRKSQSPTKAMRQQIFTNNKRQLVDSKKKDLNQIFRQKFVDAKIESIKKLKVVPCINLQEQKIQQEKNLELQKIAFQFSQELQKFKVSETRDTALTNCYNLIQKYCSNQEACTILINTILSCSKQSLNPMTNQINQAALEFELLTLAELCKQFESIVQKSNLVSKIMNLLVSLMQDANDSTLKAITYVICSICKYSLSQVQDDEKYQEIIKPWLDQLKNIANQSQNQFVLCYLLYWFHLHKNQQMFTSLAKQLVNLINSKTFILNENYIFSFNMILCEQGFISYTPQCCQLIDIIIKQETLTQPIIESCKLLITIRNILKGAPNKMISSKTVYLLHMIKLQDSILDFLKNLQVDRRIQVQCISKEAYVAWKDQQENDQQKANINSPLGNMQITNLNEMRRQNKLKRQNSPAQVQQGSPSQQSQEQNKIQPIRTHALQAVIDDAYKKIDFIDQPYLSFKLRGFSQQLRANQFQRKGTGTGGGTPNDKKRSTSDSVENKLSKSKLLDIVKQSQDRISTDRQKNQHQLSEKFQILDEVKEENRRAMILTNTKQITNESSLNPNRQLQQQKNNQNKLGQNQQTFIPTIKIASENQLNLSHKDIIQKEIDSNIFDISESHIEDKQNIEFADSLENLNFRAKWNQQNEKDQIKSQIIYQGQNRQKIEVSNIQQETMIDEIKENAQENVFNNDKKEVPHNKLIEHTPEKTINQNQSSISQISLFKKSQLSDQNDISKYSKVNQKISLAAGNIELRGNSDIQEVNFDEQNENTQENQEEIQLTGNQQENMLKSAKLIPTEESLIQKIQSFIKPIKYNVNNFHNFPDSKEDKIIESTWIPQSLESNLEIKTRKNGIKIYSEEKFQEQQANKESERTEPALVKSKQMKSSEKQENQSLQQQSEQKYQKVQNRHKTASEQKQQLQSEDLISFEDNQENTPQIQEKPQILEKQKQITNSKIFQNDQAGKKQMKYSNKSTSKQETPPIRNNQNNLNPVTNSNKIEQFEKNLNKQITYPQQIIPIDSKPKMEQKQPKKWQKIIQLLDYGEIDLAYQQIISENDDLQTIRLMIISGPQLQKLKVKTLKQLKGFIQNLSNSNLLDILAVDLYQQAVDCQLMDELTLEEREQLQLLLYDMSGSENDLIGGRAASIYNSVNWEE